MNGSWDPTVVISVCVPVHSCRRGRGRGRGRGRDARAAPVVSVAAGRVDADVRENRGGRRGDRIMNEDVQEDDSRVVGTGKPERTGLFDPKARWGHDLYDPSTSRGGRRGGGRGGGGRSGGSGSQAAPRAEDSLPPPSSQQQAQQQGDAAAPSRGGRRQAPREGGAGVVVKLASAAAAASTSPSQPTTASHTTVTGPNSTTMFIVRGLDTPPVARGLDMKPGPLNAAGKVAAESGASAGGSPAGPITPSTGSVAAGLTVSAPAPVPAPVPAPAPAPGPPATGPIPTPAGGRDGPGVDNRSGFAPSFMPGSRGPTGMQVPSSQYFNAPPQGSYPPGPDAGMYYGPQDGPAPRYGRGGGGGGGYPPVEGGPYYGYPPEPYEAPRYYDDSGRGDRGGMGPGGGLSSRGGGAPAGRGGRGGGFSGRQYDGPATPSPGSGPSPGFTRPSAADEVPSRGMGGGGSRGYSSPHPGGPGPRVGGAPVDVPPGFEGSTVMSPSHGFMGYPVPTMSPPSSSMSFGARSPVFASPLPVAPLPGADMGYGGYGDWSYPPVRVVSLACGLR